MRETDTWIKDQSTVIFTQQPARPTDNLAAMVSFAVRNIAEQGGVKAPEGQQFQELGDNTLPAPAAQIKLSLRQERSKRVDDSIELEQDASRLARNAIGISQNIAAHRVDLNSANIIDTKKADLNRGQRAIPKNPIADGRLGHFQGRHAPAQTTKGRKRTLIGEPAKQVTLHRPSGAQSFPGAITVS